MGFKLKALLSSLGAVAVAVALMVVPAPAETGGHFTSEANETVLFGYHIAKTAEFKAFGVP